MYLSPGIDDLMHLSVGMQQQFKGECGGYCVKLHIVVSSM